MILGQFRRQFLKIKISIRTLLVGQKVIFDFKGSFLSFVFEFRIFWSKAKLIFGQFQAWSVHFFFKIWTLLVGQKVDYFLYCQKVFFDFKGSFLTFVFEFGIFWSKAKLIFGQFRAILLQGPSKSGRSLWVKKWISTEVLKKVFF